MPYSVQLYSVRDSMTTDLPGTIRRLAEIGFTRAEPYNFVATADALAAALADNGVTAPSGHAPLLNSGEGGATQDEVFAAANRLGIGTVIDPFVPAEQWTTAADIRATAEQLNAAALKAADHGIRVGYHNHWWEIANSIEGETALEYFAGQLDPRVVLEVDTYWVAVGGQNPVDVLARLGDRVRFIHIKDGLIDTDVAAHGPATSVPTGQVPAGQGDIAIWDVVEAAGALEVGVVEFDAYSGDIFEGLTESLAFLRKGRPGA